MLSNLLVDVYGTFKTTAAPTFVIDRFFNIRTFVEGRGL